MAESECSYAVSLLAPAQYELEQIARLHLSLSGAASARKITNRIYAAMEQLSRFPLSGPLFRDAELREMGYRYLVVGNYIVIYRLLGETVAVYHIFDGRSDYQTLLRSALFQ